MGDWLHREDRKNGNIERDDMFVLNLLTFPLYIFGLFFIGWSINHVLYLNATLEFQKTFLEITAKIMVQVP